MSDLLKTVRAQADKLGIEYHHRAGAEKIAGLVAAHLSEHPEDALKLAGEAAAAQVAQEEVKVNEGDIPQPNQPLKRNDDEPPVKPLKATEYRQKAAAERAKQIGALRRVRITCMNPAKREWPGEIISVGSAKFGTFKKYIPFNGEPYHIPQIIYDVLKERKCTLYRTVRNGDRRGGTRREGYQAAEFNIQDLPPLTPKELEELRDKQQMAKAGL